MKEREMPSYIRMPFPLTPLASLFSALASIRFDLDVALLLLMKVRFALLPDTVTQVAVKASSWLRPSMASSSPCTAITVARLMTTGCSTHGRQARHPRSRCSCACPSSLPGGSIHLPLFDSAVIPDRQLLIGVTLLVRIIQMQRFGFAVRSNPVEGMLLCFFKFPL